MKPSVFCIGGLGGSGTRLITDVLQKHNMFIGHALNDSLDNLLFTLLFRRPSWFNQLPHDGEIRKSIDIFSKFMTSTKGVDISPLYKTFAKNVISDNDIAIYSQEQWMEHLKNHLQKIENSPKCRSTWGWKEPNTHVFLSQLVCAIPKLKYIHVVREGLYMMTSSNQNQLNMWAGLYGIKPELYENTSHAQLDYWMAANSKTIDTENLNKNNFYLANYDSICINPEYEINKLLQFLEIEPNFSAIEKIATSIVHKTLTADERDKQQHSLSKSQVQKYEQLTRKFCTVSSL